MELRSRIRVSAVILVPIVLIILNGLLIFLMARGFFLHLHNMFNIFLYSFILVLAIDFLIIGYFYFLLIQTRRLIRYEFDIPVDTVCEDACFSLFCTPCVIIQMGQHTADYATYAASCCSDTGFSRHIELKFPNDLDDDESELE